MTWFSHASRGLAVRAVFWRRCIDWVVVNIPFYFHPLLVFVSTLVFFVIAAPARRTVVRHLGIILPGSAAAMNYVRAFRVFLNFAWTLTDASVHRLLKAPFICEVEGSELLDQLAATQGAIALTAHMGNYNLGAAIFVEKFQREIRMVRAPEADPRAAQHLDRSIEQSAAGAVKVDYNTDGTALSFDLLNALRRGEIISIQGDRAEGTVARYATMFGRQALLPSGPFVLALAANAPIFPLFVIRAGYRRYRFIARDPIICARTGTSSRDQNIAAAMQQWADVLAPMVSDGWRHWHAFTPIFQ